MQHWSFYPDRSRALRVRCLGVDYLEAVARLLPGATVKKDGNYWSWRVVVDGRKPKVGDLLEHSNEWLTAIGQAVIAFNRLDED